MNEVIRQLNERKSVRVFTDEQITNEEKLMILNAAAQAPTAGNQQLYTIIDVTDQALKDALSESCDHQPFIAKAPMVLIFCADCRKWYDLYTSKDCSPRLPGVGDLLSAVTDATIAAQNAVTAAWSLEIGSCYIGDVTENCELHRELLHLPEYVYPAVMIVFGYPTQQQKDRKKPERFDLSHIVHENAYRTMDVSELDTMYAPRAGQTGLTDWCRAFCNRKYNADYSKERTRSVGEYLKQFER